jgi:DNA-binding HxlR family transcriptional regulator
MAGSTTLDQVVNCVRIKSPDPDYSLWGCVMNSESFEAISHPLRIRILRILSRKPMGFAELKRELGIKSSGKLDFHLKKLKNLITLDEHGNYTLTRDGYAALEAVSTIDKYGWQKRAYILNLILYIIINLYTSITSYSLWLTIVFPLSTVWIVFYSYWSIVKRRIFRAL